MFKSRIHKLQPMGKIGPAAHFLQRKQSTVKETSGDYEIIRIVNTFSFTEIYFLWHIDICAL